MPRASQLKLVAVFLSLTAALLAGNRLFAGDRTSSNHPARPSGSSGGSYAAAPLPAKADNTSTRETSWAWDWTIAPPAAMEKLKDIGSHLGRALDIAVDLFSGNQADLLSKNHTALLSGNAPKVLSENTTPILSGNTFSLLSNIKVEIHIDNSGNTMAGGAAAQPAPRQAAPTPEPARNRSPR